MSRILSRSCALITTAITVGLVACGGPPRPRAGYQPPPITLTAPLEHTFAADAVAQPPAGMHPYTLGPGRPSRWLVQAVPDAAGGKALVQIDEDDNHSRYPLALLDGVIARDLRVGVHARAVRGQLDRSFGVILRARDDRNFYLARANTSEISPENVRLYVFVDGKRSQLDEWEGSAKPGVWHDLALEAVGDQLTVRFDGKPVIKRRDTTFREAGGVGVWTKAESVSQFDRITIAPAP